MRGLAGVVAIVIGLSLLIDVLDYLATTERRLRALESEGNVIRGPWAKREADNEHV